MSASAVPPGWQHDPSHWRSRLPVLALALVGCAIATYLTLYQVGAVNHIWEPFFGDGSHYILRESAIVRFLHFPDAALGACAYLLEAVAECLGGRGRWRTWPRAVFATGAISAGLAVVALFLVACQIWWFHHYCTLCMASAACSLIIAACVAPEVWAAVRYHGFRPMARGSRWARGSGASQ